MKHCKISRAIAAVSVPAAAMLFASACADDVVMTESDFTDYKSALYSYGYIRNAVAPSARLADLYRTDVERKVEVGLTRAMDRAVTMNVIIDETVLEEYNRANRQDYEMLPIDLVTIGQGGRIVIPPGYTTVDPVAVTISPSAELITGNTYVIPLRISSDDAEVVMTYQQDNYLFYVIAQGDRIDPEKSAGYKVLSCMETGDADPRIHCELFLANEGKPLTDFVVLFSANLNYNASEGRVYVFMNNSVSPILNNRDRYVKPLQDMGIKVLLSLMGNWDPAGVSHLEKETAIRFIDTEVKPLIEAYGLDGVFWDDEYTTPDASIPGFSNSDRNNASRLIFEFKRAMPDKLNTVYSYGQLNGLYTVDGVLPGEYVDYMIADYGATINLNSWSGATSAQGMPYPAQLVQGNRGNPAQIVNGNWGGIMVFGLSEHRSNWTSAAIPALENIAAVMFGDQLYYTGVSYPLEW